MPAVDNLTRCRPSDHLLIIAFGYTATGHGLGALILNVAPTSIGRARLHDRAFKAGVWTISGHGTEMVTRLLSTLIMTRLLFPEAFGLIAAATSLMVGLALISDFGIRTVILQSPRGNHEGFLQTAWTLQACRGLGLWLVLALACFLISLPEVRSVLPAGSVFADPQLSLVTAALGFVLAIGGLESTAVHLNVRELALKPIFFLDLAARFTSLPIMVFWAWLAPSVWALVAGALVAAIVRLAISHVSLPGPRMSFQWDKDHAREIIQFGKWINISSAATFVGAQGDRLILGLLLPASVFGTYAIARMLFEAAQGIFERLNATLALPVLSEIIRRDRRDLKDRYYRFRWPFDLSAPLLGGFLVSAGSLIVSVLFDRRYAAAGPMVQILGMALLVFPSLLMGSAFTANGEPRIGAIVSIVQAISLFLCVTLGFVMAGTIGAIWGTAIHKLLPAAALLLFARGKGWVDLRKELRVLPIFVAGVAIGEATLGVARAIGIAVP